MGINKRIIVHKGNIIHTPTPERFECYQGQYLVHGKQIEGIYHDVQSIVEALDCKVDDMEILDHGDSLIIPGFVDIHCHASQFANLGLGLDKPLLGWLETYTFPEESRFKDMAYAEKVYTRFVQSLIQNGTMRSVLFATIHKESTVFLMQLLERKGLSAYVGLVNMDRNAPENLLVDAGRALDETLHWYADSSKASVRPILTPRFIPTCSDELMHGLSRLRMDLDAPMQSHLSENRDEVEWVKALCPDSRDYTDAYDKRGILSSKTIMAHCVYNDDSEISLLKERGVTVAHCPNANSNLASGLMEVRRFLDAGVRVGLGSDIGAGHQLFVPKIMTHAMQMSKQVNAVNNKALKPLSPSEAFHMGTMGGGAFFGNVGCFNEGMEADILIIDDQMIGTVEELSLEERIQRFIYCGDDRTIVKRFCCGKEIEA